MQTTHMATPVLEVAHLEKVYGALGNVTRALNDVSFTVNRGEVLHSNNRTWNDYEYKLL